jgi:hypothetical protein
VRQILQGLGAVAIVWWSFEPAGRLHPTNSEILPSA